MTTLVLALYAEGRTDERFLPIVIQRTAEQLLVQRGRITVDVLEPIVLNDIKDRASTQAERILEAARLSSGYHILIIHADADHSTPERALNERIQPGVKLVQQSKEPVCSRLVPIIPVRMTEAWLLADPEALRVVIGTDLEIQSLGLPERAHQVESILDPKQALREAIQRALAHRPRRRRRIDLGTVYEPLARQISLKRLDAVPAYQLFVTYMTETLIGLNLLSD